MLAPLDLSEARAGLLKSRLKKMQATEAIAPQLFTLGAVDSENATFRRITITHVRRDLNPLMQERMQQVAYYLSVTTPFGKRIIEIITSYAVGDGFSFTAQDGRTHAVIDHFWNDKVNDLDDNLEQWARELNIFGELLLPVAVNPVDGSVRVGYIDPQEIDDIEYGTMKTAQASEIAIPVAVRLKQRLGDPKPRRLRIIRRDEDVYSETYGHLSGDCFYLSINKAKGASRGISEIFALSDWIDVFDQMIFDFADKTRFLNAFVWHYILNGADGKEVEDFRQRVTKSPPRQGGIQVTNDAVQIEARTPDLRGADMSNVSEVVKKYGLGGAGLPAWFFADPIDANRSTAAEMGGPTGKKLKSKQREVIKLVGWLLDFALDQAQVHGVLPEGEPQDYQIVVPDMGLRDIETGARSMQQIAAALVIAEEQAWLQPETAARAFHIAISHIGVEVADDEYKKAQAALLQKQAQQLNALAPQQRLAIALKQLPRAQKETQVQ